VRRQTSKEFAANFLRKRCGYPEEKARRMAGAPRNILKAEWDESDHPRDEYGKFTDGDGSSSNSSGAYERFTPSHVEGFDAKEFEKVFPGVDARDFFEGMVGPDSDPKYINVQKTIDGEYQINVRDGGTVHGHPVEFYSRLFIPADKSVNHDYLVFKEKGAGNAKELFQKSVDLYDKMGIEKIRVHAALEMGAYTWSKYGFQYEDDEARLAHLNSFENDEAKGLNERMEELLPKSEIQRMSPEEYADYEAVRDVLRTRDNRMNQLLADLEVPELDKLVSHIEEDGLKKGSGFIKLLFYKTHWTGFLNLDKNSPDRKRLEAYLKSKPRAKKADDLIDKLSVAWQSWTMKTAKSAPKGFSTKVGKKFTDTPIMENLLGDEPDVSKTSRDLAVKLDLLKNIVDRLGKK